MLPRVLALAQAALSSQQVHHAAAAASAARQFPLGLAFGSSLWP